MSGAVVLVAFAVFGVIFVQRWFSSIPSPEKKLSSELPVPIAEFPDGEIRKIVGKVSEDDEVLTTPLTGRRCVAYKVSIEERVNTDHGVQWATVVEDVKITSFIVTDASGRARVDPTYAKLMLRQDARFESGTFRDAAPRLREYLAHHGESSEGFVFNRNLRYHEGALELDETAAVMGPGQLVDDPDSTGSKLLEIRWRTTDAPIITDAPTITG